MPPKGYTCASCRPLLGRRVLVAPPPTPPPRPGRCPGPPGPGPLGARGTAVAAKARGGGRDRVGQVPEGGGTPPERRTAAPLSIMPLDYAHPDGKRIGLTVSRMRATHKDLDGGEREVPGQGALLWPGRPGASRLYFPLVGMVPRSGSASPPPTTSSATPRAASRPPRRCPARTPGTSSRGRGSLPTTRPLGRVQGRRAAEAEGVRARLRRAGRGGAAAATTRSATPRTLEIIRARLGERRLYLHGRIIQHPTSGRCTPRQFPSHVRRMVFDAMVNPDEAGLVPQQPRPVRGVRGPPLGRLQEWVAEHDAVYGLGDAARAVQDSATRRRARGWRRSRRRDDQARPVAGRS